MHGQNVSGTVYQTPMPPFAGALNDADIADIAKALGNLCCAGVAGNTANATVYASVPEWLKEAFQGFLPTVPVVERAYVAEYSWWGPPP